MLCYTHSACHFRRVRKICAKQLLASSCLSVCLSVRLKKNWAPSGRIFMKFYIRVVFKNLLRKFRFHSDMTRMTGTSHEDRCRIIIISRSILLIIRNVSNTCCRENQNTYFMFNNVFFPTNWWRLWDNLEKYGTTRQTTGDNIWHMRCACWITKAIGTHSEYVLLFNGNSAHANALHSYSIRTLPVVLMLTTSLLT